MGEIIELNQNQKLTHENVDEILKALSSAMGDESNDLTSMFGSLFAMSEENFALVAPGVLEAYQLSVNNPNDRIALVQALNSTGGRAEDLIEAFSTIVEEIDKLESLSTQKRDFVKQMLAILINAVSETEGIAKRYIQIPIELCHPEAKLPQYANVTDSGMDVFALDDYTIAPGETKLIPTGIKLAIPPGYEIQVRPKSGRALKTKLRVANTPGTIDAGYRDEVGIIIENVEPPIKDIAYEFDENGRPVISSILHGSSYTIGKGEKFAQLVLMEVPKAALYRVESISEIPNDGRKGGFGSSGLM